MKFDSRYSAPIRPIFRIPAIILGIAQLVLGAVYLIDGGFKVGLPQTIMGIVFLTVGIKVQLPKWSDPEEINNEIETQISEGRLGTRKLCLLALGGLLLVITVLATMFVATEIFSIGWWIAVVCTLFSFVGFFLHSSILLESKGFHYMLTLTILFPIILLLIGVIYPKKFEQLNLA